MLHPRAARALQSCPGSGSWASLLRQQPAAAYRLQIEMASALAAGGGRRSNNSSSALQRLPAGLVSPIRFSACSSVLDSLARQTSPLLNSMLFDSFADAVGSSIAIRISGTQKQPTQPARAFASLSSSSYSFSSSSSSSAAAAAAAAAFSSSSESSSSAPVYQAAGASASPPASGLSAGAPSGSASFSGPAVGSVNSSAISPASSAASFSSSSPSAAASSSGSLHSSSSSSAGSAQPASTVPASSTTTTTTTTTTTSTTATATATGTATATPTTAAAAASSSSGGPSGLLSNVPHPPSPSASASTASTSSGSSASSSSSSSSSSSNSTSTTLPLSKTLLIERFPQTGTEYRYTLGASSPSGAASAAVAVGGTTGVIGSGSTAGGSSGAGGLGAGSVGLGGPGLSRRRWGADGKEVSGKGLYYRFQQLRAQVRSLFLPAGYPHSVTSDWAHYYRWVCVQAVCGSASYVLSTKALLSAVGVGTEIAIPGAAAISWILKDGIGSLGMMLFAKHATRFDTDTKRNKIFGDMLHNLGVALDLLTGVFPASFLVLASLGNVAKGLAAVAGAATRASFNKHFGLRENIGDLTAKATAQGVACYMVGMSIGIGLSLLPWNQSSGPEVFCTFLSLAALHVGASWRALNCVELCSINLQRGAVLVQCFVQENSVPTPARMASELEPILRMPPIVRSIELGAAVRQLTQQQSDLQHLVELYLNERFIMNVVSSNLHDDSQTQFKVVLHQDAGARDQLLAVFQVALLRQRLAADAAKTVPQQLFAGGRGWTLNPAEPLGVRCADLLRETLLAAKTWFGDMMVEIEKKGWKPDLMPMMTRAESSVVWSRGLGQSVG